MSARRQRRSLPAVTVPVPACRHCGGVPMPRWLCCRACWDRRCTTGPDELPDEREGIAVRFPDRAGEQPILDWKRAA